MPRLRRSGVGPPSILRSNGWLVMRRERGRGMLRARTKHEQSPHEGTRAAFEAPQEALGGRAVFAAAAAADGACERFHPAQVVGLGRAAIGDMAHRMMRRAIRRGVPARSAAAPVDTTALVQ